MNITDSKIKFMKGGNIYTLLQKDENSKIKFHYNGNVINIATKQEVLDNLPNISYNDTAKIYYYLNGECIQLAVKEDIEYFSTYNLLLNNKNTEIIYDATICEAHDNSISLITNAADESMYTIDYTTETELNFNSITQDSLTGGKLSIVDLDVSKNIHNLSNSSSIGNYELNNTTIQSGYSTLSYIEVEEV